MKPQLTIDEYMKIYGRVEKAKEIIMKDAEVYKHFYVYRKEVRLL